MRILPKNKEKLERPQSIRFAPETSEKIELAVDKLNLAKQDVIRLATDIGLAHLEAVKYDLAKAVLNESGRLKR